MASRNETVYRLAQEWLIWLNSRRFLGQPAPKNILVMLAEKNLGGKEPPNGPMSAEIAAFNLAVNALEDARDMMPFIALYCDYRPKPVKTMAAELGIERDVFYDRAHSAASKVLKNARQLEALNAQMQREVEDYVN